jgi:uncharacterized protein
MHAIVPAGFSVLRALCACLALLCAAACASVGSQPTGLAVLPIYTLTKPDGGWVKIAGARHTMPRDFRWRTAAWERAFAAADVIVTEVVDPFSGARLFSDRGFRAKVTRRAPPFLNELLGNELFWAFAGRASAEGEFGPRDARFLQTIEPWAACFGLIAGFAAPPERPAETPFAMSNGMEEGLGIDLQSQIDGHRAGKRLEGLETAEMIAAKFSSLTDEEATGCIVARMGRSAVPDRNTGPDAFEAWVGGDFDRLRALNLVAPPEMSGVLRVLLTKRDRHFADRVAAFMDGPDNYLVIVGAAHLGGADGLIANLRGMGFNPVRAEERPF